MKNMKNNNGAGRRRVLQLGLVFATFGAGSWPALAGAYEDFFKAVKFDDAGRVRSLLQRGFDPNSVEHLRGETGLMMALREKSMHVFDVLLNARGINLEAHAKNGDTALMLAAFSGNLAAANALLAHGAEANQTGWTALHYAASAGHDDIVRLLLDRYAYIDAASPNGTTPLMMAARAGHILTVKLLLDEGADLSLKNNLGMSALDFAKKHEHRDIAEGLTYRLQKAGKLR